MADKKIGFEATEEIAVSLPNVFKCEKCGRLVSCFHPPDPSVCPSCSCPFEDGCMVCKEGLGMQANGERALHFGIDENGDAHVVTARGHTIYKSVVCTNPLTGTKLGFGPEEGACMIVEDVTLEMERYADMVKRMKEGG